MIELLIMIQELHGFGKFRNLYYEKNRVKDFKLTLYDGKKGGGNNYFNFRERFMRSRSCRRKIVIEEF